MRCLLLIVSYLRYLSWSFRKDLLRHHLLFVPLDVAAILVWMSTAKNYFQSLHHLRVNWLLGWEGWFTEWSRPRYYVALLHPLSFTQVLGNFPLPLTARAVLPLPVFLSWFLIPSWLVQDAWSDYSFGSNTDNLNVSLLHPHVFFFQMTDVYDGACFASGAFLEFDLDVIAWRSVDVAQLSVIALSSIFCLFPLKFIRF